MEESDEIVIDVNHVYKDFILPSGKANTIKGLFTSFYKRSNKNKATQHALKDITLQVKKGEFFGIVGRNGSGKSTLLKMLAGIYSPTQGSLSTEGKLVPFIELGVGFNPELTGRENVYLNGSMMGFTQAETEAMYDEIVEFAELEDFMGQKLKNYSSGMQVRLAFSVAVKAQADILLVDEVLAVGDADFQRKCFAYFKSLKKDKKTVVFVTHDMNAVREFCDRAALIEKSEIVAIDKANYIASQYSKLFINDNDTDDEYKLDKDNSNQTRWGDGKVRIESIILKDKLLTDKTKQLSIKIKIKAKVDIDNIVAGFAIKDGFGDEICGTNTQIQKLPLLPMKKNSERTIEWECLNIFSDGKHTIDIAIHGVDGVSVNDWWEEAAQFSVKRTEKTAYKIDPPISLKISD